jgi:phosphonate degradation associated HDIG domain protein
MGLDLDDIARLFVERGGVAYAGEPVSQTEHALQTAWRAEQADAPASLVVAAFLHDLGHLTRQPAGNGDSPTLRGIDDLHQYIALPFLRARFGPAVLGPIRLHVDAKRYLCAVRPGYVQTLSSDSLRSLALQGGIFDAEDAAGFIGQAWAQEAVQLRLWDDAAKVEAAATPPIETYLALAARVALPSRALALKQRT